MRSRVIRRAGAGGERWCAPPLGTGGDTRAAGAVGGMQHFSSTVRPDGAAGGEEHRLGREEGFAKGYEEGLQAAREEMSASVRALSALAANLLRPLESLDEQVEDELARFALAIARQVVRRELSSDPQQVIDVVRQARSALSDVRGRLCIALHPEEAPLVRRMFSDDQVLAGVDIEQDPSISRGGCTLRTDVSFVDARVETRIARIAVQLLGDERQGAERDG